MSIEQLICSINQKIQTHNYERWAWMRLPMKFRIWAKRTLQAAKHKVLITPRIMWFAIKYSMEILFAAAKMVALAVRIEVHKKPPDGGLFSWSS